MTRSWRSRLLASLVNSAEEPDTLTTVAELDRVWDDYSYSGRHERTRAELDAVARGSGRGYAPCSPLTAPGPSTSSTRCSARRERSPSWSGTATSTGTSTPSTQQAPLDTRILVETAMAMIDVIRADEMSRLATSAPTTPVTTLCSTCRATGPGASARRPAATGTPWRPTAPGSARPPTEEPAQHLDEDLGLLAVHPVPGALDRDPPVAREPVVHRLDVVGVHVRRVGAADPQHRPVVRRGAGQRGLGPVGDGVEIAAQQLEVEVPPPVVAVPPQALQQEPTHGRVRHRLAQRVLGLGPAA